MTAPWFDDSDTGELLWNLLPRFYRTAASATGDDALTPLLAVLARSYGMLREDVARLYDDMFLETCRPEFVPYFAADLNVTTLPAGGIDPALDRCWVGAAARLRRRRGTLGAAVEAARIATGYSIEIVPGPARLARTPSVRTPVAPGRGTVRNADLSRRGSRIGAPAPDVAEVSVRTVPGRAVTASDAARIGPGAFTFDPAGVDTPLYDRPDGVDRPRTGPLSRLADGPLPFVVRYRDIDGELVTVGRERIVAADLGDETGVDLPAGSVAVDVARGRLLFAAASPAVLPDRVEVDYVGAGTCGVGAEPQERRGVPLRSDASEPDSTEPDSTVTGGSGQLRRDLAAAVVPGAVVSIVFDDNRTRAVAGHADAGTVRVGESARLSLTAAAGSRPVLAGPLRVELAPGSVLTVTGMSFTDAVTVVGSGTVLLDRSTIVPADRPGLRLREEGGVLLAALTGTITGAVVTEGEVGLSATSTILDGGAGRVAFESRDETRQRPLLDGVTALGDVVAPAVDLDACLVAGRLHTDRERSRVRRSVVAETDSLAPVLRSRRFGSPGYARPDERNGDDVLYGNGRGEQLGAFGQQHEAARLSTLHRVLAEYLPSGWRPTIRVQP